MVTIEDILQSYNARTNPDVISGEKTQSQVLQEFLTTFDVGTQDGRVTLKEFEDYYAGISASIEDDAYFQLMMWNAWNLGANKNGKTRIHGEAPANETTLIGRPF